MSNKKSIDIKQDIIVALEEKIEEQNRLIDLLNHDIMMYNQIFNLKSWLFKYKTSQKDIERLESFLGRDL